MIKDSALRIGRRLYWTMRFLQVVLLRETVRLLPTVLVLETVN